MMIAATAFLVAISLAAEDASPSASEAARRARTADRASPYKETRNVVYDEVHGVALVMDVFEPTGRRNGLGIVDVASGSYFSDRGKIEDHRRARMFDIFCERGYTVFAIRPGSITKFTLPEMLSNVKQAIRWVKAHAGEYGIDPDRLGITGASAGGHLCSLAAVTGKPGNQNSRNPLGRFDTKVKAACAFFPPTDFTSFGSGKLDVGPDKPLPGFLGPLLFPKGVDGKSKEQILDAIRKISPALQVTSDSPPFLLIHGDADVVVPLQQSERMLAALESAKVPAKLVVKKGGGHPWPTIHEEVRLAADWFDEQLQSKSAESSTASN